MAAEAIGLGSSILGIAGGGIAVVKTLRKLVGSLTAAEQRIRDLYSDVQLTADILEDLGKMVEKYEKEYKITSSNFEAMKETCDRNFKRLEKALGQALLEEREELELRNSGEAKPHQKLAKGKSSLSAWEKLKFALGGEDELKDLLSSLETAKSNLLLLLDWLNLFVLKEMSKKSFLDGEQALDLKLLLRDLPVLIKGMKNATFVAWNPAQENSHVEEKKETSEGSGAATAAGDLLKPTSPDTPKGQLQVQSPNSNTNYTDVRHPIISPTVPPVGGPAVHGLFSTSGAETGAEVEEVTRRSSVDDRSFYEGWVLERNTFKSEPKLAILCGIKLRLYTEAYQTHKYSIEPFTRDAQKLRLWIAKFKTLCSEKWKKPNAMAVLGTFNRDARNEVKWLLETRNKSVRHPFIWRVEAIVPLDERNNTLYRAARMNSLQKAVRWLVIIRGGQPEVVELAEDDMPKLYSDPWENIENTRRTEVPMHYSYSSDSRTESEESFELRRRAGRRSGFPRPSYRTERLEKVHSDRPGRPPRPPAPVERIVVEEIQETRKDKSPDESDEMESPELSEEGLEKMMDDVLATFTQSDESGLTEREIK